MKCTVIINTNKFLASQHRLLYVPKSPGHLPNVSIAALLMSRSLSLSTTTKNLFSLLSSAILLIHLSSDYAVRLYIFSWEWPWLTPACRPGAAVYTYSLPWITNRPTLKQNQDNSQGKVKTWKWYWPHHPASVVQSIQGLILIVARTIFTLFHVLIVVIKRRVLNHFHMFTIHIWVHSADIQKCWWR